MNFRLDNSTNRHARSCVNCAHVALPGEVHECPAFLTHAEVVEQARKDRLMLNYEVVCPAGTYRRHATLAEARAWASDHDCVPAHRHAIFQFLPDYGWAACHPEGDEA